MEHILFGEPAARALLIQPVFESEKKLPELEFAEISEATGSSDICIAAVSVDNWNEDLSPWPAPPVFGDEAFGGNADRTLKYILETLIPSVRTLAPEVNHDIYIGGYSLAGLFALWAVYKTDVFRGAAAVSPSVWFPGFTDLTSKQRPLSEMIYLSLGDKEEKTRNPVMASVGDCIRQVHENLENNGVQTILEWNPGNHFNGPAIRTARGFSWLLFNSDLRDRV